MVGFPSEGGIVQTNLSESWRNARQVAGNMKSATIVLQTKLTNQTVAGNEIMAYMAMLAVWKAVLSGIAAEPGIVAYAQAQINNPTYDITATFNAMMAAVQGVIDWMAANFPKDGSGNLLYVQWLGDGSGRIQYTGFTPAQTAGLRTAMTALVAAID